MHNVLHRLPAEQRISYRIALILGLVGHDGALVESIAFNRRVVDSTPALAAI